MSVYIKGMEMPQTCRDCPLEQPYDGYNCAINKKSYSWALSDRPSDCPLIPVPPHGRCIDADALAKMLGITDMDCYKCAWGNYGFCRRGGDFSGACEAIEAAPTIIPASKEGEG